MTFGDLRTPLYIASITGYSQIVTLLLEAGADPNVRDVHLSLILFLCLGPHVRFSHSGRSSVILWTPLHRATLWSHIPIMMQLHNKNANLNAIDENNWTPLHVAVKWNRLQAVELLITLGANVTIKVRFFFHNVPLQLTTPEYLSNS